MIIIIAQQTNIAIVANMFGVSHLYNHSHKGTSLYIQLKMMQIFARISGVVSRGVEVRDAAIPHGPQDIFYCKELSSPKYSVPWIDEP